MSFFDQESNVQESKVLEPNVRFKRTPFSVG